jgi:hypothetical protein
MPSVEAWVNIEQRPFRGIKAAVAIYFVAEGVRQAPKDVDSNEDANRSGVSLDSGTHFCTM